MSLKSLKKRLKKWTETIAKWLAVAAWVTAPLWAKAVTAWKKVKKLAPKWAMKAAKPIKGILKKIKKVAKK